MGAEIGYMDEGIVRIRLTGPQTIADYRKQTEEALKLARSRNVELFLVDDQNARNTASALELFAMPAMYEELGAPRSAKVAIVMQHNSPSAADIRFYETVCVNRGFNVKIFAAERAALAWLMGDERDSPGRPAAA
jgi:hypothetical protein